MFDLFAVPRALKIKRLLFAVALLPPLLLITSFVLCLLEVFWKISFFKTYTTPTEGWGGDRLPDWWEFAYTQIALLFLSPFLFLVQRKWGIVNPQIAIFKGSKPKPFKEVNAKLYILKMAAISALAVSFLAIIVFIFAYFWPAFTNHTERLKYLKHMGHEFISNIFISVSCFCCFLGSLLYLYISRPKYKPSSEFDL